MKRIDIARLFLFVREASAPNTGLRVEAVQRWCDGRPGDSWCCYFATMVLDLEFQGKSPIARSGVCEYVHNIAKVRGWIIPEPEVGCLVLSVNALNHAHHIAICTGTAPLTAIAGNTSPDGLSSNGNGVYEHPIAPTGKVYVRVPNE